MEKQTLEGPYVAFATICETFIQESNNILSLIKILDTITVQGESEEFVPGAVKFVIAVGFKSGGFVGTKQLSIAAVRPSGEQTALNQQTLAFQNGAAGANLLLGTLFGVRTAGLHWFDVSLDNTLVSRIPLTILYEQADESRSNRRIPAKQKKTSKRRKKM